MIKDLTGKRFGRLTVISRFGSDKFGQSVWNTLCECGKQSKALTGNLSRGKIRSCGCLCSEITTSMNKARKRRGEVDQRFFTIYKSILARCYDKNGVQYSNYGGRGIKISDEWKDFSVFSEEMYESYCSHRDQFGVRNTTIERIDVNGNYCKKNCKWATQKEQQRNRRNNTILELNGEKMCIAEWGEVLGMRPNLISNRLFAGWSVERALTTPVKGSI